LPYLDPNSGQWVYTDTGTGTSFSVPQITGAAALLYQIDPNFSPAQVAQILEETGTPVYDSATGDNYPLLNLDAAITQAYVTAGQAYGLDNTIASATPLSFDRSGVAAQSGLDLLVHNDSYFSFSLSGAQQVQFGFSPTASSLPPFSLYNSSRALIGSLSDGQSLTLQGGTYYLKASANSESSLDGTYGFSISQTPAGSTGNTSLGSALPIDLSSGQGDMADQQLLNGQSDYYSFSLSSTSDTTITLNYNGSDGPPTGELLNSSGNSIAAFNGSQYDGTLDAGNYYIEIAASATLQSTFSLAIDASAIPPAPILSGSISGPNRGSVSVSVANSGTARLGKPYRVDIYASTSRSLGQSAIFLGSVDVQQALDANRTTQISVPLATPRGTPAGEYHLIAMAGPRHQLTQIASTRREYPFGSSSMVARPTAQNAADLFSAATPFSPPAATDDSTSNSPGILTTTGSILE